MGVSTINKLLRMSMRCRWSHQQANWSDQPVDRAGITSLVQPMSPQTAANQDIDISSRLLRTRYRTGQLDTWFWVVLLRVLRFPPPFFEKILRAYKKRQKEKRIEKIKDFKIN